MSPHLDPSDVPAVPAALLHALLDIAIETGNGLVALRPARHSELAAIEAQFWTRHRGTTAEGVAAIVRFRAVLDTFAVRRLEERLLVGGLPVLREALRWAAGARINAARGFAPQLLVMALAERRTRSAFPEDAAPPERARSGLG